MLREELPGAPEIWRYREQARRQSMINTPPTFNIYLVGLVLRWLKAQGGAAAMARASAEKSRRLYAAIDASDFYSNPVRVDSRSRMNAPFFLADESLTGAFVAAAEVAGLIGLKGHAALGGIRASLYNSMPLAGVDALDRFYERIRARARIGAPFIPSRSRLWFPKTPRSPKRPLRVRCRSACSRRKARRRRANGR